MRLFFLIFILIYASLHFCALRAATSAFDIIPGVKAGIALVMLILMFAPFIVRYSERTGHESAAIAAAYIGYLWMGFLLYFVMASLTFDMYRLFLFFAGALSRHYMKSIEFLRIKPSVSFYISVIFAAAVCVYGYLEAREIHIEKVVIRTNKVSSPVKIAQISDVHVGLLVRGKRLQAIVDAIAGENPDVLLCTGDLVDGQLDNVTSFAGYFEALKPPLGKFAITGNHEFYAGLSQSLEFTRRCGFRILRNESADIGNSVVIAGVDDPEAARFAAPPNTSEKDLLTGIPPDRYTVLLKHRPEIHEGEDGLFDLQLSGHTHKGQLFPFNIITWLYYSKHPGLSDLAAWIYFPGHSAPARVNERGVMYINRGAGTWGPPIRVLSPPEIAIFELIPGDAK